MAFKMKGFTPFTKNGLGLNLGTIGSWIKPKTREQKVSEKLKGSGFGVDPALDAIANKKKTWKERWDEKYPDGYAKYKEDNKIPDYKRPRREPYGPEQAHGVRPAKVVKGTSMSPKEQKKIQKTISKHGHFGDTPSKLTKGYGSRDSHAYRKRMAEINAHHHYLSHANPYNQKRMKGRLQEKLRMIKNR
jgi:hypothetical protein